MKAAMVALLCGCLGWAQEQVGRISGTVVDSVSHLPVRKAQVMLLSRKGTSDSALTDASGAFAFSGLAPGVYDVQAGHRSYPQRPMGPTRQSVTIRTGEETRVTLELVPGAMVSGRVVDEDGDPLAGCMVQVFASGRDTRDLAFAGSGSSNDNGQYRIPNILQGRYIAAIQCPRPVFQPRPLSPGPPPPPSLAYPPQYYSLAADPQGAQVLELSPGLDKAGVDFRMTPARVYSIGGPLTSAGADWRTRTDLMLMLVSRDRGQPRNFGMMGADLDREKGTFEFQSVFPGSYTLLAYSHGDGNAPMGVQQALDVTDQPLAINLQLHPGVEITGTVEIDESQKTPPGGFHIRMNSMDQLGIGPEAQAEANGTFTLKGVTPGTWQVQVFSQNMFVQSITAGGRELTDRILDTSRGPVGPLRIVLSTKTATIRGHGLPGRQIRIVPLGNVERFSSMSMLDDRGEFSFRGLAPGAYRISVENGDPDGKEVTVAERETVTVDLKPQ